MNMKAITAAAADHDAEREKVELARQQAERDYFAIIKDPKRTSDADKATLSAAMKTLGKTPAQAMEDARAISAGQHLETATGDASDAHGQLHAARAAQRTFHTETKLQMQEAINQLRRNLEADEQAAAKRYDEAQMAAYELSRLGRKYPHLLAHLPEAAGKPIFPRLANGVSYNPLGESV